MDLRQLTMVAVIIPAQHFAVPGSIRSSAEITTEKITVLNQVREPCKSIA